MNIFFYFLTKHMKIIPKNVNMYRMKLKFESRIANIHFYENLQTIANFYDIFTE